MYRPEEILPHKENMVLIDRVVSLNMEERELVAEVNIKPEMTFFDEAINGVPTWVGIEFMAQTIGALSGIYYTEVKGEPVKMGFIIGSKNYQCFTDSFNNGDKLIVKVKQLFSDFELGSFDCKILKDNKVLSQTELNVFQPVEVDEFINKMLLDK